MQNWYVMIHLIRRKSSPSYPEPSLVARVWAPFGRQREQIHGQGWPKEVAMVLVVTQGYNQVKR